MRGKEFIGPQDVLADMIGSEDVQRIYGVSSEDSDRPGDPFEGIEDPYVRVQAGLATESVRFAMMCGDKAGERQGRTRLEGVLSEVGVKLKGDK